MPVSNVKTAEAQFWPLLKTRDILIKSEQRKKYLMSGPTISIFRRLHNNTLTPPEVPNGSTALDSEVLPPF